MYINKQETIPVIIPPPFYPESGLEIDRNKLSMILKNQLYLTNYRGTKDEELVLTTGITNILSVGEEFDQKPLENHGIENFCD